MFEGTDLWQPILLTLELAAVTTIILLLVGTPIAWWLARSTARWKEAVATVVALPLVLPPTVLGFYLLIALGPNGPGGWIASLGGGRTLAFTFEGLVIGSVIYSMPFVVQPIRNAFEAFGDRPLEVAATLRASPRDAFWTVAVPLARPGFLTGAVLGFAHTVGEFGVVLMIGGNIPGETKVLSVAIYDYVETLRWTEAHILSAGMLIFSVRRHPRDDLDREARGAGSGHERRGRRPDRCALSGHARRVRARRRFRGADARRDRAVRPVGLRQDHGAALRRRASRCCATAISRSVARCGRTARRSGRPMQRSVGYVFQEASLFPHLSVRGNLLYGHRRALRRGAEQVTRFDDVVALLGMEGLLERSPLRLSGGERQRVAVGRALLSRSPGCCSWTSRWPGSTA